MHTLTARFTIVMSLLLVSFSALATDRYVVSATLFEDGAPFATPLVVVEEGAPGMIKVSGKDGYEL